MERIQQAKRTGLHAGHLRTFGMGFALIGIVGKGVLQNQLLGMGHVTSQELLVAMQSSDLMMTYATVSLVMQALETCAVPIFAFLLSEGFTHTGNFQSYFLRIFALACASEIPYNLAIHGTLLEFSSRNPVFGLVLALIVLYFFNRYSEKSFKNSLIQALVALAAIGWGSMLHVSYGSCTIILAVVLWLMRNKPLLRGMVGAAAAMICSIYSLFFMASPMSFLAIHFYNGERGAQNKVINYLAYPVILLAVFFIRAIL